MLSIFIKRQKIVMENCTHLPEWNKLKKHYESMAHCKMSDWFKTDNMRFQRFSLKINNIFLDYSKNRINPDTLSLLINLANACHLKENITALFKGEMVNNSEKRPALHTALRAKTETLLVNEKNIMADIGTVKKKMRVFTDKVRSMQWQGATGKPINQIVNVGIGGSHAGPLMATRALKSYAHPHMEFHFISNVDPLEIESLLKQIDPERTLFIISSKSFTTIETLTNAHTIKTWLHHYFKSRGVDDVSQHFIGVTQATEKAIAFGIHPEHIFPLWEWVGGRYSIWSAIGLPLALAIGMDAFEEFLNGAEKMDDHFQNAPFAENMPVILALLGIWYINFFNFPHQAIITYSHALKYLRMYLQQLDMESNGKNIAKCGNPINFPTAPIIWGDEGCDGQHTYYQLLHQGQHVVPIDFILVGPNNKNFEGHHDVLFSSALSQAQALLEGKSYEEAYHELKHHGYSDHLSREVAKYKIHPGNRPSTFIVLDRLTPANLGALLALYEHKVFVQGVLWQINSFDQWGVELGKKLLPSILNHVSSEALASSASTDPSTQGLINYYKCLKNNL